MTQAVKTNIESSFPHVRACIFDVDGTLINSEDIYSEIYNNILREYGKPNYPWRIKAVQQSRGTSVSSYVAQSSPQPILNLSQGTLRLLEWAQIPLSIDEWKAKQKPYTNLFTHSALLPGVSTLLSTLSANASPPLRLALASSAGHQLFALKTSHLPAIAAAFASASCRVFGDDPEMARCDKKPSPDIFALALRRLNEAIAAGREEPELRPEECLVFEDSIAGVEAGRRAGMRVVWVPHQGLAEVCRGREMDVLMGRTEKDGRPPDFGEVRAESGVVTVASGRDGFVSEDGRAEMRKSLEDFPYSKYGINVQL